MMDFNTSNQRIDFTFHNFIVFSRAGAKYKDFPDIVPMLIHKHKQDRSLVFLGYSGFLIATI
jgi:hypothetical protein